MKESTQNLAKNLQITSNNNGKILRRLLYSVDTF